MAETSITSCTWILIKILQMFANQSYSYLIGSLLDEILEAAKSNYRSCSIFQVGFKKSFSVALPSTQKRHICLYRGVERLFES